MMSDGIHNMSDYVTLAQSDPTFDAVGKIHDHSTGSMQTCVLVGNRTVLTAAHGVINNKNPQKIVVTFNRGEKKQSYHASTVTIDPRYLRSPNDMIDFAIITLEGDVEDIQPAQMREALPQEDQPELICITYGNRDIDPMFKTKRRAFYLPEVSTYHYHGGIPEFNASTALSSLYIAPEKDFRGPKPSLWMRILGFFFGKKELFEDESEFLEAEIYNRLDDGFKAWENLKRPPYALALPGSSGAPVFIKHRGKWILFGMITSFAHLASPLFEVRSHENLAEVILSTPREKLYGHFQTVFTLLYKSTLEKGSHVYVLDKDIVGKG